MENLVNELLKEIIQNSTKAGKPRLLEATGENVLSWSAIPEISISEIGWSDMTTNEDGEEVPGEMRAQLLDFLKNIPGPTIKEKIKAIDDFYQFDAAKLQAQGFFGDTQASMISQIMAYLVFYKTLTTIITHFNAASAGFSFEAFLGVLLLGGQIKTGSKTIADLYTQDGTPVSLKLYAEKKLKVGGSYTDLVNDLVKHGKMQYIAVTKDLNEVKPGKELQQKGTLKFYRFNFNLDNIFNILARSAGSESPRNIILPAGFGEEVKINPNYRIEDTLSGIGKMPAPEALEKEFVDVLEQLVAKNDFSNLTTATGEGFNFEKFANMINWAKDPEIFGKNKQRGTATIAMNSGNPLVARFTEEYQLPRGKKGPEIKYVRPLINIVRDATLKVNARYASKRQAGLRVGQIKQAYFVGRSKQGLIEKSRKIYNALESEEQKKAALLSSHGYISRPKKNFEINQNMVIDIKRLAEPNPGELFPEGQDASEIGTIEIGAAQVDKMLKNVSKILNKAIFDIFNSLKLLTTNIQGYFAGGLADDNKALAAKEAAHNIEEKTEEVRPTTGEGEGLAESRQQINFNKLIEQMIEESFN
jgi:hypothetical protein